MCAHCKYFCLVTNILLVKTDYDNFFILYKYNSYPKERNNTYELL